MCITTLTQNKQRDQKPVLQNKSLTDNYNQYSIKRIEVKNGYEGTSTEDKYCATVNINRILVQVEIDSGVRHSLIPKNDFNALRLNVTLRL